MYNNNYNNQYQQQQQQYQNNGQQNYQQNGNMPNMNNGGQQNYQQNNGGQNYQQNNNYQGGQQQAQEQGAGLLLQGRIVWTSGKLFEGKVQLDEKTNRPVLDQQGNPVIVYGFGLAVPKVDPRTGQQSEQYTKWWNMIQSEARAIFPNGNIPNEFAWKYKDGDAIDHNGKPFADREGYRGCVVIACTTQLPIKYFKWEGNTNIIVNDGIKCGDYVNVQLNIKGHPAVGRGKPGLYINPNACQLIAPGKEIINAPSGDQMFGGAAPSFTAGEMVAPTEPVMPGMNNNMGNMPNMNNGQQNYQNNNNYQQNMNGGQNWNNNQGGQQADPHYGVLPNSHQPNNNNGGQNYQQNNNNYQQNGNMLNMNNGQQNNNYQNNNGGMPSMPGMPR